VRLLVGAQLLPQRGINGGCPLAQDSSPFVDIVQHPSPEVPQHGDRHPDGRSFSALGHEWMLGIGWGVVGGAR
jgi:hypothetical protein